MHLQNEPLLPKQCTEWCYGALLRELHLSEPSSAITSHLSHRAAHQGTAIGKHRCWGERRALAAQAPLC